MSTLDDALERKHTIDFLRGAAAVAHNPDFEGRLRHAAALLENDFKRPLWVRTYATRDARRVVEVQRLVKKVTGQRKAIRDLQRRLSEET